ncbi:MAG: hypothetical protein J6Q80_04195 [Lentisphaeria bacterium]|nr:hypothetical protein [Lentisphaeria bacterium]
MIKSIKRIRNYIVARRRGQIAGHVWFDSERAGDVLRNSPVPGVVMLTLVWMVCTVVLTLSYQKQHDVSDWIIGQRVPYSVIAKCNFSFRDLDATEAKRSEAKENAPEFFRIDSRRSEDIYHRFNAFWEAVKESMIFRTTSVPAGRPIRLHLHLPKVAPRSLPEFLAKSIFRVRDTSIPVSVSSALSQAV